MAPEGQRLRAVQIRQPDGSYAPINPLRLYTVVTNNFIRQGGDGYGVFRDHGLNAYDTGPAVDEVVTAAIARVATLAPQLDGRITAQ